MSGCPAHCLNCDHSWRTRKPPSEIDRPRCSECGAERDAITFESGTDDDSNDVADNSPTSDVVQTAKRERRLRELHDGVTEQIERVVRTAPEDTDRTVARELLGPYWELRALEDQLTDSTTDAHTLDELNAVRNRLDALESEIDDYAGALATIDGLSDTISDLQSERQTLQTEIEDLRVKKTDYQAEIARLKNEIQEHKGVIKRLDEKDELWQAGYEYGKREGRIEVSDQNSIHTLR